MPVQEFPDLDRSTGEKRRNYWGYNPVAPFAPKAAYGGDGTPQGAIGDFKTMVRELHAAGIEIILDIVLNHTAEGGEDGPHDICDSDEGPSLAADAPLVVSRNGMVILVGIR